MRPTEAHDVRLEKRERKTCETNASFRPESAVIFGLPTGTFDAV
jgi:hypothetical protein